MSTVIVPLAMEFTANGAANVQQTQQESLNPYTADFAISIGNTSTNDVFTAFEIEEGAQDASADIVVSTVAGNEAVVKAALSHALQNAQSGASKTLKTLMEEYVQAEVEADLATTGLFNILEAERLTAVDIPNATIGTNGSNAAWTALANADGTQFLQLIATQLPYAQYEDISDGGNLDAAFAIGDSLVFHFTVNTKLTITPVFGDVTESVANGTLGDAAPVGSAEGPFDSATKSRTVNLTITKVGV